MGRNTCGDFSRNHMGSLPSIAVIHCRRGWLKARAYDTSLEVFRITQQEYDTLFLSIPLCYLRSILARKEENCHCKICILWQVVRHDTCAMYKGKYQIITWKLKGDTLPWSTPYSSHRITNYRGVKREQDEKRTIFNSLTNFNSQNGIFLLGLKSQWLIFAFVEHNSSFADGCPWGPKATKKKIRRFQTEYLNNWQTKWTFHDPLIFYRDVQLDFAIDKYLLFAPLLGYFFQMDFSAVGKRKKRIQYAFTKLNSEIWIEINWLSLHRQSNSISSDQSNWFSRGLGRVYRLWI